MLKDGYVLDPNDLFKEIPRSLKEYFHYGYLTQDGSPEKIYEWAVASKKPADHIPVQFENGILKKEFQAFKELSALGARLILERGVITGVSLFGVKIDYFPESLFSLYGLRFLDISDTEIRAIPQKIRELISLEEFYMDRLLKPRLPDSLSRLKKIRVFSAAESMLKKVPLVLCKLASLEWLNLDDNGLKKLPPEISNLSLLRWLYLADNELEFLPETIGNLRDLESLYLGDNSLYDLPDSMKNMTRLKRLYVPGNSFVRFPMVICEFNSLRELDIMNNKFQRLPECLQKLNIEKLYF